MTKKRTIKEERDLDTFKAGVRRAQKRNEHRRERSQVKQVLKKYL
jgi:hypothetical protein